MKVKLAYGQEGLEVELPDRHVTVLEPRHTPGLPDEAAALQEALRRPLGTLPLRELVSERDSVAIVFSDLTRPMPNDRVLLVLLRELEHVPRDNVVLINALGTHRCQTHDELIRMLGQEIVNKYRVIQHDAADRESLVYLGKTSFGHHAWVNRAYMSAEVKILTGFIEPHIFAGFSGGPKAVLPGVAGEELILDNHSYDMIGHPKATWGITDGNPIYEEMCEVALMTKPAFLLNVTLNKQRQITGVFTGDLQQAHRQGTNYARKVAMVPVAEPFDIVITSNSGYPLDLNLYQAVKGMSAAAQIVKPGGAIIVAAECWDGIPDHGHYKELLHQSSSPRQLLDIVSAPGFRLVDQWEGQLQALIQLKATVYLKNSYLGDDEVRQALLLPCHRLEDTVADLLAKYGPDATICVLPEGPQTIPYLVQEG